MAAKPAGCLGKVLSVTFTSVVAPVLVGVALHGLNGSASPPAPPEPPRLGAALPAALEEGAPRALVSRAAADQPTDRRSAARRDGGWTNPVPLVR